MISRPALIDSERISGNAQLAALRLEGPPILDSNLIPKDLADFLRDTANRIKNLTIWLPTLDTFRTFAA